MDIMKTYHGALAKSVRFYLNTTTGLIEPIFYDGHAVEGRISNLIISDFIQENKLDLKNCGWICQDNFENYIWFQKFFGNANKINDEFIQNI